MTITLVCKANRNRVCMRQLTEQLGASVYVDTNIIMYAAEGYETYATRIKVAAETLEGLKGGLTAA